MSEKFAKIVIYTALTISVLFGILLTVIGGFIEGWAGVITMLAGQTVFILLLYLYNRKYK